MPTWVYAGEKLKDALRGTSESRHRNHQASDTLSVFEVLPRRWVVERTFAWLGNFRRLSKDYEVKPAHEEAIIYLASTSLLSRRLAKSKAA